MNTSRPRLAVRIACALILFLSLGAWSQAQVTIYAKFLDGTGVWAGTSPDAGRSAWVNLDSFSMSFTNAGNIMDPSNPVVFHPAALSKAVDRLTPQIFARTASASPLHNGALPADVTIEFVNMETANKVVFFRIELKLVIFSSLSNASSTGDTTVHEDVTLQFGAARVTNWPILPDGTPGTPTIQSWSRVTNQPNFDVD